MQYDPLYNPGVPSYKAMNHNSWGNNPPVYPRPELPSRPSNPPVQGWVVNDASNISPNDVPRDGKVYLFAENGYSRIVGMQWREDGILQKVVYSMDNEIDSPKSQNPQINELARRLDALEKALGGVENGQSK